MEQNLIAQVFAAHLALIGTDVKAWSDLLAEDAIVEFPDPAVPVLLGNNADMVF